MKYKSLIFSLFSLLIITSSCDDDLNSVGLGTKPGGDNVSVYPDTIFMQNYVTTIKADMVRFDPNVNVFLMGSFYDRFFGSLKADFINQFYPPKDLFDENMQSIDTVSVYYLYLKDSWYGDSIAPMKAMVYPAKQEYNNHIAQYRYTDTDLSGLANMNTLWGSTPYTARDLSLKDSLYNARSYGMVKVDISSGKINGVPIGKAFFDEWAKGSPNAFDNISSFRTFFPGLYTTTSSTGSVLPVKIIEMVFRYKYLKDENLRDSTAIIYATSDVMQSCQYKDGDEQFPIDITGRDTSYIKAPAGVYTQYTIPLGDIAGKIGTRQINSVLLSLSALPKDDWKYALDPPSTLMLIRSDSLENFFANKHTSVASPTSYRAAYSSYTYNFGDISAMIRKGISEGLNELNVVLVPIKEVSSTIQYGSSAYSYITNTAYDITPSGVKLRTDKDHLRLLILSSDISRK